MRSRVVVFLGGIALAAIAACLNPQPLPPEDDPQATTSSSSGSSGFSSSSSGGKVDDGEIVPPAPHSEAGTQGPDDGGDAAPDGDAGTDGSPADASDAG